MNCMHLETALEIQFQTHTTALPSLLRGRGRGNISEVPNKYGSEYDHTLEHTHARAHTHTHIYLQTHTVAFPSFRQTHATASPKQLATRTVQFHSGNNTYSHSGNNT